MADDMRDRLMRAALAAAESPTRRETEAILDAVLPLIADRLESLAVDGNGWQAGMESAAEILRDLADRGGR